MKKQTEYALMEIQRYGCYFCCLCEIAERMAQKKLTDAQVSEVFKSGKTTDGINGEPMIGENCFLSDPAGVANTALSLLGSAKRLAQIGQKRSDEPPEYWGGLGSYADRVVECHKTDFGLHFTLADYNPDPRIPLKGKEREIYYKEV